jgi:hypothetical protein
MDKKIDFLYASILDTQATIRSIDVKSGFLFVLLFTPIYTFDNISHLYLAILNEPKWFHCAVIVNITIWLLAITSLLMSVAAISNPSNHVSGANEPGSFYGGYLFSINFLDVFVNRKNTSTRTVLQETLTLPENEASIISELTFEKIKLSYIRTVKMKRFTFCIYSTFTWMITGILLYILYLQK